MSLIYRDAKNLLSQYAGRGGSCPSAPGIDLFVREVFEYLLYSGAYQDLREFTFTACKGVFTIPYEIESIQKVRIDNQVGNVQDKWFDYRSSRSLGGECLSPENALFEEANYFPTAYSIPLGGSQVATLGVCDEADDASIIISGKDLSGREIFTQHKGVQISGEYLSIKKGCKIYSQVKFAEITGIKKTKTNGYVQLLWIDTCSGKQGFLSDYSPLEEVPAYRRYKLRTLDTSSMYVKVSVLARIRLKEKYADNDRIPFDTLLTMRVAGQSVNAQYNNDLPTAQAKDITMNSLIERESEHKRVSNGIPIEMMYGISAGKIRNTVGGWGFRRFR